MHKLQSKIQNLWYGERPRWILWLPVFLGLGISLYFSLPYEPPLISTLLAPWCFLLAAWLMRGRPWLGGLLLVIGCIALGLAVATWRSASIAAPIVQQSLYPQWIEGRVAVITPRADSIRLTVEDVIIPSLSKEETPHRVTISLRGTEESGVQLGDTIRIKAGFFPPPLPVIAGGYAFNRHFYFQRIGAMGYAVGNSRPEVVMRPPPQQGFPHLIQSARHAIASHLIATMGEREGPTAAALMVGEQGAIPDDIYEAMRQSGLVHILSISGLHLTLAAGILYFSMRGIFALFPHFAGRYDSKKPAALFALVSSLAYLLLAGAPISAQRAFIMVALVLCAVLLSRHVTPIRSLCLAALVILMLAPESLLNPGFQLSFAATLGILAYYEYWRERPYQHKETPSGFWQRQGRFWGGIIATSVIATAATTPYILHHFNGLPVYSVLANLLVMPLASFIIMPLVVLALFLFPLGLVDMVLPALQWSIWLMHTMAEWVITLPHAIVDLPPLSTTALAVVTLGGLWLCFWQQYWRHLGWIPICCGLASLWWYQPPDMVISADGKKIALRTGADSVVMLRGQRSGFVQDGWLRFLQVDQLAPRGDAPTEVLRCDDSGCIAEWKGKRIAVIHRRDALEDCRNADITFAPHWSAYYAARQLCPDALFFDRIAIRQSGGMSVWLDARDIHILTVMETLGNRPWSTPRR